MASFGQRQKHPERREWGRFQMLTQPHSANPYLISMTRNVAACNVSSSIPTALKPLGHVIGHHVRIIHLDHFDGRAHIDRKRVHVCAFA